MNIPPAEWFFPLCMSVPFIFLHLCRVIFQTTSHFNMLGKWYNVLAVIFFQECELAWIGCAHFWIRKVFHKFRFPTLPLHLAMFGLMFLIYGFTVYDFENTRHNFQMVLFSTLKAYVIDTGNRYYEVPPYIIKGSFPRHEGAMKVVRTTIIDAPGFWLTFIGFNLLCAITAVYLILKNWDRVRGTVMNEMGRVEREQESWRKTCIVFHIFAGIHLFAMTLFCLAGANQKFRWLSYRPFSYNTMVEVTHYESRLSKDHKKTLLSNTRRYLPPGRYWIDNRTNPVYFGVHGDKRAFCAYNNQAAECKGFSPTPSPEPIKEMPNVVLFVYESLNPLTYLIDEQFINEHAKGDSNDPKYFVTDTPYWNNDTMPFMRKLAEDSITFSGLSTLGLPTFSGWHGLLTGAVPSQTYMNIIDGWKSHVDDLPSFMRNEDYRTLLVSSQPFDFDGMQNWLFRKSAIEEAEIKLKCLEAYEDLIDDEIQLSLTDGIAKGFRNCSADPNLRREVEKRAQKLKHLEKPKWFDYLAFYFPNEKQAKVLNLSYDSLVFHDWIADRIIHHQFQLHWQQQMNILRKKGQKDTPIFTLFLDVECHMPYDGYDNISFYDQIDKAIPKHSNKHKELRFKRVNKYADLYFIGKSIEWLKKNHPNTIILVTGDHGTRDIPIRSKNSRVTDEVVLSGDCVGGSSGVDSFFVVSGMVGYLGDDPAVKRALGLDRHAGRTLKIATDHSDLVYTIMDTVSKLRGHSLGPTHRRSRNLADLMDEVVNLSQTRGNAAVVDKLNSDGWQSLSMVAYQHDYRRGAEFLRTHISDNSGAHYYPNVSFPTCLKRKGEPDMPTGGKIAHNMRRGLFAFLAHENYLFRTNRLYHSSFRNKTCIEEGHCEMPQRVPYSLNDDVFWVVIFGFPALWAILGIVITIACWLYTRFVIVWTKYRTIDQNTIDDNQLPEEEEVASISMECDTYK